MRFSTVPRDSRAPLPDMCPLTYSVRAYVVYGASPLVQAWFCWSFLEGPRGPHGWCLRVIQRIDLQSSFAHQDGIVPVQSEILRFHCGLWGKF